MMLAASAFGGGGGARSGVCGRDQCHKGAAAIRVPDRKLHRRKRPRRPTDHRRLRDVQMIQQIDNRIGLPLGRRVHWKGAAQITKARRCDNLPPGCNQPCCKAQPLIKPAPGAVDHDAGRAGALHSIFHQAKATFKHNAAPTEPRFRTVQVGFERLPRRNATDPGGGRHDPQSKKLSTLHERPPPGAACLPFFGRPRPNLRQFRRNRHTRATPINPPDQCSFERRTGSPLASSFPIPALGDTTGRSSCFRST